MLLPLDVELSSFLSRDSWLPFPSPMALTKGQIFATAQFFACSALEMVPFSTED